MHGEGSVISHEKKQQHLCFVSKEHCTGVYMGQVAREPVTTPSVSGLTGLFVGDGLDFQDVLHVDGQVVTGDQDLLVIVTQSAVVLLSGVGGVRQVEVCTCGGEGAG